VYGDSAGSRYVYSDTDDQLIMGEQASAVYASCGGGQASQQAGGLA